MAVIDLQKFTFVGDVLKGVGELSFELMASVRNALTFVTTFGNINVQKEVGFLGEGGLVGKASSGCDPVPQEFSIGTRKVTWKPKDWEVLLHLCYTDLDGTIAEYERKHGIDRGDFTDSDYEAIVETMLARALNKFLWRLLWFNDTTADHIENGGRINDDVDLDYFNLIDGYWKQIFTQVTNTGDKQYVDVEDYDFSNGEVKNFLDAIYYKAPMALRQQSDKVFYVTQSVYDAYEQYLSDVNKIPLESVKSILFDGIDVLKFHGIELVPMPEWDENIVAYEDNANPYRALFTSKKVLGAGFDRLNDFTDIASWYDRDTRKVKIEAGGNGDAKLLAPDLFVAGY